GCKRPSIDVTIWQIMWGRMLFTICLIVAPAARVKHRVRTRKWPRCGGSHRLAQSLWRFAAIEADIAGNVKNGAVHGGFLVDPGKGPPIMSAGAFDLPIGTQPSHHLLERRRRQKGMSARDLIFGSIRRSLGVSGKEATRRKAVADRLAQH